MNKIVLLITLTLALFTTLSANALAPYDIRLMQRDPTNVGYFQRDLALPVGGAHGIIGMNGTSMLPQYILGGTGINLTGSTIGVASSVYDRANHTGTQASTTISDFTEAAQDSVGTIISGTGSAGVTYNDSTNTITINVPAIPSQISYIGTVQKTNLIRISKTATVSGANVVFNLTDNGGGVGTTLCPNGNVYLDSLTLRAIEGTTPHAFATPSLSNGNKTVTIGVSKLASVLGILTLNQSASGSDVSMSVQCD